MKYNTLQDAQDYLYSFRSKGDFFAQGGAGFNFDRVMHFSEILGNPQNKIKVIHVAGTSGKGSTCAMLSHILKSHGIKVGLSISPHLFDLRERVQINNDIIPIDMFCGYLNETIPAIHKVDEKRFGKLTFFEIMIVMAYYIFWKENVGYAVMETGAGGRLDATNVATAQNKVAVITKIGLDHMDMLGNTITKIASEKAGIIHKKNLVLSIAQKPSARTVIKEIAEKNQTNVHIVHRGRNYRNIISRDDVIFFDFDYKNFMLKDIKLSVAAHYQVENAALALATIHEISLRDSIPFDTSTIRNALSSISIAGRFQEVMVKEKKIIIDGAHNTQKMSVFIDSLKKRHPGKSFDFLIGFKKNKDYNSMLKYIVPLSKEIIITEFRGDDQARMIEPEKSEKIRTDIEQKSGFKNIKNFINPIKAFEYARKNRDTILVITGSLYMISAILKVIKN